MTHLGLDRRATLLIPLLLGMAARAGAQSVAGAWEGLASGQRISVTLDSAAAGWRGRLLAPGFRPDTILITAVTVTRDSVVLRLPADLTGAVFRGALSPDRVRLGGRIFAATDSSALFRLARAGPPAAAQLLAEIRPRSSGPRRLYLDPDSARLISSDILRFWAGFDHAPADSLEEVLQRECSRSGGPDPGPSRSVCGRAAGHAARRRSRAGNSRRVPGDEGTP